MSSRVSNVSIIAPKLTAAYSIATGDHPSLLVMVIYGKYRSLTVTDVNNKMFGL